MARADCTETSGFSPAATTLKILQITGRPARPAESTRSMMIEVFDCSPVSTRLAATVRPAGSPIGLFSPGSATRSPRADMPVGPAAVVMPSVRMKPSSAAA
jgi:hypothetical protein